MNFEKCYNKKICKWINDLIEIENILKKDKINEDLKSVLWDKFKEIIDEYNESYLELWENGRYDDMYKVDNMINIVYNDLIKLR